MQRACKHHASKSAQLFSSPHSRSVPASNHELHDSTSIRTDISATSATSHSGRLASTSSNLSAMSATSQSGRLASISTGGRLSRGSRGSSAGGYMMMNGRGSAKEKCQEDKDHEPTAGVLKNTSSFPSTSPFPAPIDTNHSAPTAAVLAAQGKQLFAGSLQLIRSRSALAPHEVPLALPPQREVEQSPKCLDHAVLVPPVAEKGFRAKLRRSLRL